MIIKAKHNILIYNFFKLYSLRKITTNFENIYISGKYNETQKPLLIISNHISWWDGFWIMYLNLKLLHRKFHFMMLEQQLQKHWYFQYSGGFSINKNSKSIIETLSYTVELLEDNNNLVLIFPQGKINSIYQNNIIFEKGIERILLKTNNIQVLNVANFIDFFSKPKPSLYIYIEEFIHKQNNYSIEKYYNHFYNKCLEIHKIKTV